MPLNRNKDPERVAECGRLITEIQDFQDQLNEWETKFISDIESNISKWGESTHISDNQYHKIQEIHERVC
jgi:hypothetical protein